MTRTSTSAMDRRDLGNWRRPVGRGLAVAAFTVIGFGGWASVAPLDSAVTASGTIVPESDRKAIQHLEGGIVTRLMVREGDRVAAGDVLLVIDPTQARAVSNSNTKTLLTLLGDQARLEAQAEGRDTIVFPDGLADAGPEGARVIEDQRRLFAEMRSSLENDIAILGQKIDAARMQATGTRATLEATTHQIASLDSEIERLRPAIDKGFVSRARLTALERERTDLDGRRSTLGAELGRAAHALEEFDIQKRQARRKASEEASGKLAENRSKIADLREKVRVSDDIVGRTEIRAPRTGRIVADHVHTVGAVVRPGETLMEIVPEDDTLVVSVKMSPLDITHVWAGLSAEVRFPSFKSRTTPTAFGEITMVAPDVVYDETTRQPHYEVKISVRTADFPEEIRHQLRPGMPVDALVKTGERTVMGYVLQPLEDAMRHGMREN